MFDIGFWEILLILVVALLVVGPEKFPGLVRTIGVLLGRARRTVQTIKEEVAHEVAADELRKTMQKHQAASKDAMDEIIEESNSILNTTANVAADVAIKDEDISETTQIPGKKDQRLHE